MKALEIWLLGYLLNSLWQVPLIFLSAWTAVRFAQKAGSRMEHRIWVIALILEAVLPACHLQPGDLWRAAWALLLPSHGVTSGQTRIVLGPFITKGAGALYLHSYILTALLIAYVGSLLYFAGRLAWGFSKTILMLRHAEPLVLEGESSRSWWRSSRIFDTKTGFATPAVEIAMSSMISGPVTVGICRRVLLVPPVFLEKVSSNDLDALLAHEFAHMRRRDFAKNIFYGVLSLPVAYHPLLWLTRSRVAESRELVCDAMAAEVVAGRGSYARSLLRLASILSDPAPAKVLHAIGIFDANNFERRIMNLTGKRIEIQGARRLAIVAACGVIAFVVCASALALRMDVNAPTAENTAPKRITAKASAIKLLHKENPVYPAEAKASGDTIDGQVVLDAVISKTGVPENIRVAKSLRDDYDRSAIDAVRQWQWQPFLLNGEPVEVETSISITYALSK